MRSLLIVSLRGKGRVNNSLCWFALVRCQPILCLSDGRAIFHGLKWFPPTMFPDQTISYSALGSVVGKVTFNGKDLGISIRFYSL